MNSTEIKTLFSKQEFELLTELNKIISAAENGYLWRELCEFDLLLKEHFTKNNSRPKVSPQDGGCWYCERIDEDLVYDDEFDTMVHPDCIRQVLKYNPNDLEVQFLSYLIENNN